MEQEWLAEFQYSLQENSCFENYCKQNKLRFDDIRFEYRGKWRRTEEMYESVLEPASIRYTFFGNGMDIVACKGERYGKDGYEIIGGEKKLPFSMNEFSYFFDHVFYVSLLKKAFDSRALDGQAYFLNAESFGIQFFYCQNKKDRLAFIFVIMIIWDELSI